MVDRKGFLFTVTVFLVLMYILLTISVWVKGVETSERAFAEFYKESTVELAIEQITPAKMDNVTYTIMNRNLARFNDHSIGYRIKPDQQNGTDNVRAAMFELLVNGTADSKYFKGSGGEINDTEDTSLSAWASGLNASLLAIGVYISGFDVTNFEMNQSDINLVNYSFDLKLELRDLTNTSAVSRVYAIENEIDISGLVDPALASETDGGNMTVYRQFFFNKADYPDHSWITADEIITQVKGGQGFLYGPLMLAKGSADHVDEIYNVPISKRHAYILVGNITEILDLGENTYRKAAGYIVTNAPAETSTSCGLHEDDTFNPLNPSGNPPNCEMDAGTPFTEKPFIVAPYFNPESADKCSVPGTNTTARCLLFVNTYLVDEVGKDILRKRDTGGSGLYNIEDIRDFVMCGYYTGNPDAPSYLQRLLEDPYSRSSPMGIETFVIGNYVNDYGTYDYNSRLDRELMNGSIQGIKIRGLPGCRNFQSCSDKPVTGVFAASAGAIADYDLGDLACDGGCDQ